MSQQVDFAVGAGQQFRGGRAVAADGGFGVAAVRSDPEEMFHAAYPRVVAVAARALVGSSGQACACLIAASPGS